MDSVGDCWLVVGIVGLPYKVVEMVDGESGKGGQ